jgi:hypothetical protein
MVRCVTHVLPTVMGYVNTFCHYKSSHINITKKHPFSRVMSYTVAG